MAQIILGWNANPEADLAGYRIHYGIASGVYTTIIDAGLVTSYTVTGLTLGQTYFFAIVAYDTSLNTSVFSDELIDPNPLNQAQLAYTQRADREFRTWVGWIGPNLQASNLNDRSAWVNRGPIFTPKQIPLDARGSGIVFLGPNLVASTLAVALPKPFKLADWPNPTLPMRYVVAVSYRRAGIDRFFYEPGRGPSYDWPNPLLAPRAVSLLTWTDQLKLSLQEKDKFFGAAGQPPANMDWPVPRGTERVISLRIGDKGTSAIVTPPTITSVGEEHISIWTASSFIFPGAIQCGSTGLS